MKLGASQGFCRCSLTSPMMGDAPSGVVAQRSCPSGVASFGRVTHAPADPRALHSATRRSLLHSSRVAPRSPNSGFLGRGLRREAAVGGRPCDHAARVPAVRVVRKPGGASDPAHRRSGGQSSCFAETGTTVPVPTLQVQFLEVVDMPAVMQRQVSMILFRNVSLSR